MPFADQRQLEIYVKLTVKKQTLAQSVNVQVPQPREEVYKGDTHMQSFNRLPYCASPKKLFSPTVCPSTSAGLSYWTLWLVATRPRITDQHTFLGYHDSCLSHEAKTPERGEIKILLLFKLLTDHLASAEISYIAVQIIYSVHCAQ